MKLKFLVLYASLSLVSFNSWAESFSLNEVLTQSLKHHPTMEASRYLELAEIQKIREAESVYYPQISGQGMYAKGLPGSAAATGVQALVVSPFHKGPAAGVVLEQTLWDFGRTGNSVLVSRGRVALSKADTQISKVSIAQTALDSYYACARDKAIGSIFSQILKEAKVVEEEVDKFVRSSQRSVVEKHLAEFQSEEIKNTAEDVEKKYEWELHRLSLLTGIEEKDHPCPELGESLLDEFKKSVLGKEAFSEEQSPSIFSAKERLNLALSEKELAYADHFPSLMGVASYGYVQDTWANIPIYNWSAAVGIVIPIFEGFKVSSRVEGARAKQMAEERNVDATRLNLNADNARFNKAIESSKIRIKNLKNEVLLAEKAFGTAKKRYFTYQGSLVDLRETLRNLSSSQIHLKISEYEFLVNSAVKALVNGAADQLN